LLSPFLVHTLGDTKYGIWSIVAALTGYMTLLDLGVSSAVAKYASKYKALNDYKSVNVVMASGIVILLVVVSAFNIDAELKETVHTLVIVVTFNVAIFVASGVMVGAFLGFQRNEITNAVVILNAIDLLAMGFVTTVANILAACALFFSMRKVEPKVKIDIRNAERSTVASIFHYSKFTFLSMLGMQLIYYSDAFVIGYFLSAAAITIYTIPWSLSEYSNKLLHAVAQTFVPVFSEQEATKDSALYATYITGTKGILLVSNLLCIGVLALGDHFIGIWMGPRYAVECSTILAIMFFTQLIKSPQLLSYSMLLGTSNHQRFATYNLLFSIANLILSITLVQHFGLVGVAGATAFTQILFYAVVTPIMTSKVINFSLIDYLKATYLRIVPASIILYLILLYFARHHSPTGYLSLLSQALIGAAVYLTVAYFTLLDKPERNYAHAAARKLTAKVVGKFA